MPRASDGSYSLPPGTIVSSGDTIQPSQHNPAMQDIAAALSKSLSRDGKGSMQSDLNMGGFDLTNVKNLAAQGVMLTGSTNPVQLYNNGGGFGASVNLFERWFVTPEGQLVVGGARNVPQGSVAPGSGNLRVFGASVGGVCISTYETNDYTPAQFVRDVAGTPTQVGSITCGLSSTSYNTASDRRLKHHIAVADDAGEVIDAIGIVSFDFINGPHVRFGVIAQDLVNVVPEAVTPGAGDAVWSWDPSKLVPMMIKEIQSLRGRIAALEHANGQ